MSKQSEAKESQNYRKKPMCCQHCTHFSSEFRDRRPEWAISKSYVITEEKNIRCTLGGFAVQKMASCDKFERSKA
jgi:hypothetical protein